MQGQVLLRFSIQVAWSVHLLQLVLSFVSYVSSFYFKTVTPGEQLVQRLIQGLTDVQGID